MLPLVNWTLAATIEPVCDTDDSVSAADGARTLPENEQEEILTWVAELKLKRTWFAVSPFNCIPILAHEAEPSDPGETFTKTVDPEGTEKASTDADDNTLAVTSKTLSPVLVPVKLSVPYELVTVPFVPYPARVVDKDVRVD